MYKKLLDSYENEVTVNIGANTMSRISQLEDVLEGYRKQVDNLETELSSRANQGEMNLSVSKVQIHTLLDTTGRKPRNWTT